VKRLTRIWGRWAAALVVAVAAQQPAHGFYFVGWPGNAKAPPLATPRPLSTSVLSGGSEPWSPGDEVPADVPPPVSVPTDSGIPTTPEPGTAVLAALGLGIAAADATVRRRAARPAPPVA
jgi:hypothetical protein